MRCGRRDELLLPRGDHGNDFILELNKSCGKPLIVVTNSPYPFSVSPEYSTVVVTYGAAPETMERTAQIIFGMACPPGRQTKR